MILVIVTVASVAHVFKIVPMVLVAIVALGVVVMVHELGHFISAKRAGVKVEAFSVGFGPRIWGIKKGETEYRISLILFGGYVKMKGMEGQDGKEPHEIEGGFFAARPGQRAGIAFAAPAMNVVLALAVFTILWFTGTRVPKGVLTTTIGYIEEGSPADQAGLVSGDTVLEVNGRPVHEWKDVVFGVAFSPTDAVDLTIQRNSTSVKKTITAEWDKALGVRTLRIDRRMDVIVAEIEKGSLAEKLRLKKGDRLAALAGQSLYHIEQFRDALRKNIGKKVALVVSREDGSPSTRTLSFTVPLPQDNIVVEFVEKGSLAAQTGLKTGDRIAKAGAQKIFTVNAFLKVLKSSAGKEIQLEVLREKKPSARPGTQAPRTEATLGAYLKEERPVLGFFPGVDYGIKKEDPITATYSAIKNVVLTLKNLVTRRVSAKGLGGPVAIVGWMAVSISVSFTFFLYFIAFLSANFAVLNLLPIPIFDGGHIMFSAIEKIRGKPVRQKTMTVIVNIFFVLILAFFLFVTKNDIMRFVKGGAEDGQERKKVVLTLKVPEDGVSVPSSPENTPAPQ